MSSSTSALLGHISVFRNPPQDAKCYNICKAALAEIAFIVLIPYTIVEAAISQLVKAIARCIKLDAAKYQKIESWAASSSRCVLWTIHSVFVNLFLKQICTTEKEFTTKILRKTIETAKDPAVSNLLRDYGLGDNAKRYSTLMEKIYGQIPEPDDLDLFGIADNIDNLLMNRCHLATVRTITNDFRDLTENQNRRVWEDRFLKMVIAIYNVVIKSEDDSLQEILAMGLQDAYAHCSNRKSTEIERLYFTYVAPDLMQAVQNSTTPEEALIFEMMQHRMKVRDTVINRICDDAHNAASHRYFRAHLNKYVFYLPSPILCAQDLRYEQYALKSKEGAIIREFRDQYESPDTIYTVFNGLLYPKQGESFQFKPAMFVQWLNDNGRMNAEAFANEDMTVYKPELVVAYLENLNFLQKK